MFNFSAPCPGGCKVRSSRVVMFECRFAMDVEWVSHRQRKMNKQKLEESSLEIEIE